MSNNIDFSEITHHLANFIISVRDVHPSEYVSLSVGILASAYMMPIPDDKRTMVGAAYVYPSLIDGLLNSMRVSEIPSDVIIAMLQTAIEQESADESANGIVVSDLTGLESVPTGDMN